MEPRHTLEIPLKLPTGKVSGALRISLLPTAADSTAALWLADTERDEAQAAGQLLEDWEYIFEVLSGEEVTRPAAIVVEPRDLFSPGHVDGRRGRLRPRCELAICPCLCTPRRATRRAN